MHLLPSRFPRLTPLGRAAALLALGCLLAACDRHSADEVPENYGHGSSHQKSFTEHTIDSRSGSRSFSDTQGLDVSKGEETAPSAASPSASPAAKTNGSFFPNGS